MDNAWPKRKGTRLQGYDYSLPGSYFLTVCTAERKNYFWKETVGARIARPYAEKVPEVPLSPYGNIVDESIQKIGETYPAVSVDCYVIMPDHIHLLLTIHADADGRPMVAPTVDRVIQQMKGVVTKRIGFPAWQKLFFDHVIRNRQDYEEHVRYIIENPMRWQEKNTT